MNPILVHYINVFVRNNWTVTSQSEFSASLEKKASSRGLAVFLGIISLIDFFVFGVIIGAISIAVSLLLIALNNATKKSGTVSISVFQDGTVQISSNIKKLNAVHPPSYQGKIKVS